MEWIQKALDELTALWTHADSALRQAITQASNTLDEELAADPSRHGESRGADERVVFVYPLGVQIQIDAAKRIVWVLHVWRFRRRGE